MGRGQEFVGRSPLFGELSAEDVAQLDAFCHWRSMKAGDVVIEECALDNDVSFVVSGRARVLRGTNGREVILKDIHAGEYFGELSAIDGRPRSARIVAVADSVVARMSAGVFRDAIHRHPSVCDHVLATFSARIRALNERFSEQIYLSRRSRNQKGVRRLSNNQPRLSRAVLDDPPIHIRPNCSRQSGCKGKNPLDSSHDGPTILPKNISAATPICAKNITS